MMIFMRCAIALLVHYLEHPLPSRQISERESAPMSLQGTVARQKLTSGEGREQFTHWVC